LQLVEILTAIGQVGLNLKIEQALDFACSAGALSGPDFCFIFAPDGCDEPEILPS
jgi:hypothetical protein